MRAAGSRLCPVWWQTISRIDLNQEYDARRTYAGDEKAVYRVVQGRQQVEFTSEMENARQLAFDIVGEKEWPPFEYWIPPM